MTITLPTMRVLIVDDEAGVLSALQRSLRKSLGSDVEICTETDAMLALERTRHEHFDVVISDLRMPEIDGVALLSLIGAVQPATVRMILTGTADFETAQRAIQDAGVFRYLTKPWIDSEVLSHVRAGLAQARVNRGEQLAAQLAQAGA